MAVKKKKPAFDAAAHNAQIMKTLYPDLPSSDDRVDDAPAADATGADTSSKRVDELMAKLAAMEGEMANLRQSNTSLMAQPVPDTAPQKPQFSTKDIPNPIDEPEKYAQYLEGRTQAEIDYARQVNEWQSRQQTKQNTRVASLWEQFNTTYADYAGDAEKVEIAATKVLQKAQAAGYDVDRYMQGAQFQKDVVAKYDTLFGKPGASDDDDDDDDNEPDVRTAGIFGGNAQGGKATGGKPAEKLGSLTDDIRAWQQKTGFSR